MTDTPCARQNSHLSHVTGEDGMGYCPGRTGEESAYPARVVVDPEALVRRVTEGLRLIGEALTPAVQAWSELAAQYVEAERAAAERRERSDPKEGS